MSPWVLSTMGPFKFSSRNGLQVERLVPFTLVALLQNLTYNVQGLSNQPVTTNSLHPLRNRALRTHLHVLLGDSELIATLSQKYGSDN